MANKRQIIKLSYYHDKLNNVSQSLKLKKTKRKIAAFLVIALLFQVLSPVGSLIHKNTASAATLYTLNIGSISPGNSAGNVSNLQASLNCGKDLAGTVHTDCTSTGYAVKTNINAVATPRPGYLFSKWIVTNDSNKTYTSNPMTFQLYKNLVVTAVFTPAYTLGFSVHGRDGATVTADSTVGTITGPGTPAILCGGISANDDCSTRFAKTTTGTASYTATPATGWKFHHWSWGPATTRTIKVPITGDYSDISAYFVPLVTVTPTVTGSGAIITTEKSTGDPTPYGSNKYGSDETLVFSAPAVAGNVFTGWTGATGPATSCNGSKADCTVVLPATYEIAGAPKPPSAIGFAIGAAFTTTATTQQNLSITNVGDGFVSSNPSGLSAGHTSQFFDVDAVNPVILTAHPGAGKEVTWSGTDAGSCLDTHAPTCSVLISQPNMAVTATFTTDGSTKLLTVAIVGTGSVTSEPAGIDTSASDMSENFATGLAGGVKLTALSGTGQTFNGWSTTTDNCPGTGDCTVTIDENKTITAVFSANPVTNVELGVTAVGDGAGSIKYTTPSITTPTDITNAKVNFPVDAVVTLTATASSGSTFTDWTGDCTQSPTLENVCVATMKLDPEGGAVMSVEASFSTSSSNFPLTVTKTGSGTVVSDDGHITGSIMTYNYPVTTPPAEVNLTATADDGYSFTGWGGACTGAGSCVVTMSQARTVSALFTADDSGQIALSVNYLGAGTGTVTSSPAGIEDGMDIANFNYGAIVVLTASPASNSNFTGWSGSGCTGTGTCSVTMNAAKTVSATFALKTTPTDTTDPDTSGTGVTTLPVTGMNIIVFIGNMLMATIFFAVLLFGSKKFRFLNFINK